jgi:hypothetical protein
MESTRKGENCKAAKKTGECKFATPPCTTFRFAATNRRETILLLTADYQDELVAGILASVPAPKVPSVRKEYPSEE